MKAWEGRTLEQHRAEILAEAERLIASGRRPIEVYGTGPDGCCHCPKGRNCKSAGKHPRGTAWQDSPGLTVAQMADVLERRPRANLGWLTGHGWLVVDVDDLEQGRMLVDRGLLPPTEQNRTGRGGLHPTYRVSDGVKLQNTAGRLAPGIDTRADGGFVVAAASVSSHGVYGPVSGEAVEAPDALLAALAPTQSQAVAPDVTAETVEPGEHAAYERTVIEREAARLAAMREAATPRGVGYAGAPWDSTTFEVACVLHQMANSPWSALTPEEADQIMRQHAPRDAGFTDADVEAKLASARRSTAGKTRPAPSSRAGDWLDDVPVSPVAPVSPETPSETGAVLDEVRAHLSRFICTVTPGDLDILALWAVHTHLTEQTYTSPRLVLDSPVPGSGKTTTLDHLQRLCVRPVQAASLSSPALLVRLLEHGPRTILIDEADRSLDPKKDGVGELIAILNSGYRQGATRPVLVPTKDGWQVSEMSTFAPVAMAGNNPSLPEDTRQRCIRVLLLPDLSGRVEESDWEVIDAETRALGARLGRWADQVREQVRTRPDLPEGIKGRDRERWGPLKRVALGRVDQEVSTSAG